MIFMKNDFTKCTNEDCPKKYGCFRYRLQAGERQSYARWEPEIMYDDAGHGKLRCKGYIKWDATTKK